MDNKLKSFQHIRKKRQECFAVYGEYANRHTTEPISANFRPKPKKFQILMEKGLILIIFRNNEKKGDVSANNHLPE
jgi:hypothetical protein